MLDRVYPFICKQNQTLFYSWGLGLPLSSEHRFNYRDLCALGKSLSLSPNTLVARFEEGSLEGYLTFKRQGGSYIVKRSSLSHSYSGIPFNPNWRSNLTSLEVILLAAIACRDLHNQSPLTYGEIAARTGYSRRQVIRHVGLLADKGYLVPCVIEEEICVTTRRGVSSKERERQSHKLSSSFRKDYLSYLKNITPEDIKFKPGNIINITDFEGSDFAKNEGKKEWKGDSGQGRSSKSQRSASKRKTPQGNTPLKAAWEVYEQSFTPGPAESLKGIETLIRQGKLKLTNTDKIIKAILKAKTIPFLRVANGFGWKEAVIECYHRKALYIGSSSRHIEKFSSSRLSFAWIIGHADEIVAGKYDEIAISPKQRDFGDLKNLCAHQYRAQSSNHKSHKTNEARATQERDLKEALIYEIRATYTNDEQNDEQKARLYLLEKVSASFYATWLKDLPITVGKGHILIHTDNPFKAHYLEKKFYTDSRIVIATEQMTPISNLGSDLGSKYSCAPQYSPTNTSCVSQVFLHEIRLTGQSFSNPMAHIIPPSHEAMELSKGAVPSFYKEEKREDVHQNRNQKTYKLHPLT